MLSLLFSAIVPLAQPILVDAAPAYALNCSSSPVGGAIGTKYAALGGAAGPLGCPKPGGEILIQNVGVFAVRREFANGAIYHFRGRGEFAVYGAIFARWNAMGREQSIGYPTSSEEGIEGTNIRYTTFERNTLFWTPERGTSLIDPRIDCRNDAVGGLIGDKWRGLGGSRSPMGCPLDDHELALPDGTIRRFYNGTMAWSPRDGAGLVTTAYQAGNNIYVAWGDSSPFNYDFHIVRWSVDGIFQDQDDVVTLRTGGWFVLPNVQIGHRYDIMVEGCDELGLPGQVARCRQGWHNTVTVYTIRYPLSPDLHLPGPPARGHWYDPDTIISIVKSLPYDKIGELIAAL